MFEGLVSFSSRVSRTSLLASAAAGSTAAVADGGAWGIWGQAEEADTNTDAAPPAVCWDTMMRRHGRRVVVALVGQGVALERAKELAQDAWLRVIDRHRAGLIPELRLPGLVITQAGFLARDDRRRAQRRAALDQPRQAAARQRGSQTAVDLEQQVHAREQLRVVHRVLDQASDNARRVFELLYGEHTMTPTEAAAELGLSVQRVRQIVCELRKRIRGALEEPSNRSGRNAR